MPTFVVRWTVAVTILLLPGATWADGSTWKVGTAKARITPEKPLWLAGYAGRNRPADGTVHDLWVKVLALEASEGTRGVVVTADLLGFPKPLANAICAQIQSASGLNRSQIMLTCSHTHCGPVLGDALQDCYPLDESQRTRIAEYTSVLEKAVVAAVAQALGSMAPATLWADTGTATFAVNRRNNREAEMPRLLAEKRPLRGPVDHRVPVLAVREPDGRLRAVLFGYACHNTTLDSYQWCGDYAGFAQIALEQKHPQAMAMFYEGCGADQNPLPRRSLDLCRKYGEQLAAAVEEVLGRSINPVPPQLATAFATIDLELQPLPPQSELEALAKGDGHRARWARRMMALVAAKEPLPKSYPYPVQAWRLGPHQRWFALGGEVVVDYALALKDRYGPQTWVAGYANDVMGYIPSRRVWEEGGYEQAAFDVYGMPSRGWTGDVESRVLAALEKLAAEVEK